MSGERLKMPVKQGSMVRKSGKVFGQGRKVAKTIRVGLYARVSTQDQQTLPMQNKAMREYAARRDWTIAMQIKEVGSGASQRELREKLMEAARRREIDIVLVWRLDRWGRSVTDLLHATGTRTSRRWLRIANRSAGPDHAGGARDGRTVVRFR